MHSGVANTGQEKGREEDLHNAGDVERLGVTEKVEKTHRDGDISNSLSIFLL